MVTSPRGAAIRDILNIVQRRHRGLNVLIYPAQVQGEAAAGEVSAAIRYFNGAQNVDVIVVARGGGSLEDLAAFNHEGLARVAAGDLTTPILIEHGDEHPVPIGEAADPVAVVCRFGDLEAAAPLPAEAIAHLGDAQALAAMVRKWRFCAHSRGFSL